MKEKLDVAFLRNSSRRVVVEAVADGLDELQMRINALMDTVVHNATALKQARALMIDLEALEDVLRLKLRYDRENG